MKDCIDSILRRFFFHLLWGQGLSQNCRCDQTAEGRAVDSDYTNQFSKKVFKLEQDRIIQYSLVSNSTSNRQSFSTIARAVGNCKVFFSTEYLQQSVTHDQKREVLLL